MSSKVDKVTGEIKFVFPNQYSLVKKYSEDLSNEYVDIYEEIPPYAVDITTGDLLNKTPDPIIKKVGVRNMQEYIDSFKDDCDIYKILERVAISGDESFLNKKVGLFGDFVNLPDNLNDMNQYVKKVFEQNKDVSKDVLEAAINSSLSSAELSKIIEKHVQEAILAASQNKNINNGGQE